MKTSPTTRPSLPFANFNEYDEYEREMRQEFCISEYLQNSKKIKKLLEENEKLMKIINQEL